MAKGTGNLITQNMSGKIGKNLVIKQYADKIVISAYPWTAKRKAYPCQKRCRDRFREAVSFAKNITRTWDPVNMELKKKYELKLKPNQQLYHFLISEYMSLLKSGDPLPVYKKLY